MISSALILASFLAAEPAPSVPELVVYTYDSIIAKDGLGEKLFPAFESKCHCKVKVLASGDAVQILSRVDLDRETKRESADVLLGIDQSLWERTQKFAEPWKKWRPKGFEKIKTEVLVADGFLPFDYGVFAFMSDTKELARKHLTAPKKLSDFLKPEWKRNFILEDPRTSTPGLAFLLFTEAVLHDNTWKFWSSLRSNWLNLAQGWSSAYGLFLKGEAPLVWSYTTSEAYHREHGDASRYLAILLADGSPLQIEGAVMMKNADPKKIELTKMFLEFLISEQIQTKIPKTQWMLPVAKNIKLPASFKQLPQPTKFIPTSTNATKIQTALQNWKQAISQP